MFWYSFYRWGLLVLDIAHFIIDMKKIEANGQGNWDVEMGVFGEETRIDRIIESSEGISWTWWIML